MDLQFLHLSMPVVVALSAIGIGSAIFLDLWLLALLSADWAEQPRSERILRACLALMFLVPLIVLQVAALRAFWGAL